uniref:Uncharacterized protein n=1 Tax=Sphaerodactylus townsendi TaxID=933632 RepID=A0ACB8GCC6_9SAUR
MYDMNRLIVMVHELGERELGEFTVLHTLTGWIPEVIPLRSGYLDKVWEFLRDVVPESKLPEESLIEPKLSVADTKKGSEIKNDIQSPVEAEAEKSQKEQKELRKLGKDCQLLTGNPSSIWEGAVETGESTAAVVMALTGLPEKLDQKEVGKKKSKDGEKVKLGVHPLRMSTDFPSSLQMFPEGFAAPLQPQMVLYACYAPLYVSERKIFELGKMAPMKPIAYTSLEVYPARKKKPLHIDEPQEPVFKKPEQFVEIASPFLNFKLYPISIPRDTHFSPAASQKGISSSMQPSI